MTIVRSTIIFVFRLMKAERSAVPTTHLNQTTTTSFDKAVPNGRRCDGRGSSRGPSYRISQEQRSLSGIRGPVPTDGHWSLFGNHSFQRALVSNLRPLTPVRHYERVRLQRAAPIMELDPDKHFELILF